MTPEISDENKISHQTFINLRILIGGVMSSVCGKSQVPSRSGQTKDYYVGIYCFSAKYAALGTKSKYWLARNQVMITCPSGKTCLPAVISES